MAKYAVACINFHDNDLEIKFVPASSWKEALSKYDKEFADSLPDDIKQAKAAAFDQDCMFEVREIPAKKGTRRGVQTSAGRSKNKPSARQA